MLGPSCAEIGASATRRERWDNEYRAQRVVVAANSLLREYGELSANIVSILFEKYYYILSLRFQALLFNYSITWFIIMPCAFNALNFARSLQCTTQILFIRCAIHYNDIY